jgi:hypothetical protein
VERLELERFVLVGPLLERLVLVGKLVEWFELERLELERIQLVGWRMARSELGPAPMSNQSGHKWLGVSWG